MRKISVVTFVLSWLLVGCSLTGDFTPPPALATSQAAQSITQPTAQPQPTSTASSDTDPLGENNEGGPGELEDMIEWGDIRGQIVNGSEGGDVPDAIEVTLYAFDDQQEVFSKTNIANENGEYQFTDLENQSGRVFIATVDYLGALYASEAVQFIVEAKLDLPITIYELTSDVANLYVDRVHVIVDIQSEAILQITELWILSNLGDQTIASPFGEGILQIEAPDEAMNLSFESGMIDSRFQGTSDGFIDLSPIRPGMGSHEVVFSFNMPLEESTLFSQPVSYPVEAIILLSPEGILTLRGEGVEDSGVRQMTGMTLHTYNMGPISPGGEIAFVINREAGAGVVSDDSSSIVEIAIGGLIFVVALGGTGFWLYRRKKGKEIALDGFRRFEKSKQEFDSMEDRDVILQTLADLDDAYEAGEIKYASYQKRREGLKKRLMEIMKRAGND